MSHCPPRRRVFGKRSYVGRLADFLKVRRVFRADPGLGGGVEQARVHWPPGVRTVAPRAPPRLNLQLSRPRGGEISRGSSAGVLPVLPRPPEVDEKLGRDIARSAKQECKDAYRAAGLLAVVPLAAQALKADSGCKW